jgi:hypothetical protein
MRASFGFSINPCGIPITCPGCGNVRKADLAVWMKSKTHSCENCSIQYIANTDDLVMGMIIDAEEPVAKDGKKKKTDYFHEEIEKIKQKRVKKTPKKITGKNVSRFPKKHKRKKKDN